VLQHNVDAVLTLHGEHALLLERVAAAEDEFIRRVAAAHHAGELDWRGLSAAYDQVREWNKTNGLGSFVQRWMAHVHYDRNTLARYAKAVPNGDDGRSWNGDTGWEGIDKAKVVPPKGMAVGFVLFGNGGAPVYIGFTEQSRARVKSLHRGGLVWQSWVAHLCDGREDAIEVRRQLIKKYGEPNVAAQPA
jgi:cold shock CspA family protein